MKVSQGEKSQGQLVLSIEVEEPEIEEHLDKVYKRLVRQANIPGFRKGKAPRSVVERFVGRDSLMEEAMETLLPQVTSQAIVEQELDVVAPPQVKVMTQDPLTVEATVALRPIVDLGEYREIRVEPEVVDVTPEEVDEMLQAMRGQSGTWEPVERPVELGDLITMDVKGEVDGEPVVEDNGVDYILTGESRNPLPGFAENLVGGNIGAELVFTLPFPDDYSDPDMIGKECQFTAVLAEVKERKLPEPDDEFAQSLNMGTDTMEALMERLRTDLEQNNQKAADRRYEELAVSALVEAAQVELPPLLVEEEVNHVLSDQAEALRRQQLSMEAYLSTVGKSLEQLQEEVRPMAAERLIRGLTLQALRDQEGVDVTLEEIEAEVDTLVSGSTTGAESLKQMLSSDESQDSIRHVLLNRKTLARLADIAKGEASTEASPTEQPSTQESKEEPEGGAQDV